MNILLIGPPASGKGTVAKHLVEQGYSHFSMGAALRKEAKKNSAFGKKIEKLIFTGKLLPKPLVFPVLKKCFPKSKISNQVFDGFPRNVTQARLFQKFLEQKNSTLDLVLFLDVPQKELLKRIQGRKTCPKCQTVYGIHDLPKKGFCPKCQLKLIVRDDDHPSVIKQRFQVYHQETVPMLDYYLKKGLLVRIDGSGSIEGVLDRVELILGILE